MGVSRRNAGRRPVVLHVVESFATGVATAVRSYARRTPECEHHLLFDLRSESGALEAGWDEEFLSTTRLPGGHLANILQTRRTILGLRPDIVHSHSSFGGGYARLAVRRSRSMKHIHTPHYWNFDRDDCHQLVRKAFWGIEGLLALNTDLIAGCSIAENLSARWGPVRPHTIFVPNVAESSHVDVTSRRERTPLVVAGAGRLSLQKDPQFFLDCLKVLRTQTPNVHPVWIGGGDDELEALLEAGGVEVTGWVSHTEALQRLQRVDVYWHTARWEGFPIMVLEAVSAGVPVVVRRIPAFAHVDLPTVLDSPDDVRRVWPTLSEAASRERIVEQSRVALWEHDPEIQRNRLLEAYAVLGHVPGGEAKTTPSGRPQPTNASVAGALDSSGKHDSPAWPRRVT